MVTHIHIPTQSSQASEPAMTRVRLFGSSQRARARGEEEERRRGPQLREGSEEDGEDGGDGGDPPAAHQRQAWRDPAERAERYYMTPIS